VVTIADSPDARAAASSPGSCRATSAGSASSGQSQIHGGRCVDRHTGAEQELGPTEHRRDRQLAPVKM
jgi:hypothetical protein